MATPLLGSFYGTSITSVIVQSNQWSSIISWHFQICVSRIRGSAANQQAASSGYLLDDIKPHQILLPSDSSDESKDYDPEIYPEGTSLDIKEDEGDKDNIKSFLSRSDDEGKKEQKEKRAEYKFRKRVAKKRKYGEKPH